MAAPTSLIKDHPHGHSAGAAMGACYSSTKSKPSPSSSAASPQTTPVGAAQTRSSTAPVSGSGLHPSKLKHVEPTESFTAAARLQGVNSHAQRSSAAADVVGLSSAATGVLAAAPHSTPSSGFSSPRHMHRSASSKGSKLSTPHMQSNHIGMKSPRLKSGVGAYEVLTSRAGVHDMASSPRKLDNSLKRANTTTGLKIDLTDFGNIAGLKMTKNLSKVESLPLASKSQGANCKNCKTSNLESVCFIANDGRIAAANTGPTTVCHANHCSSPKCAANPNYQPPSSSPCRKVLLSKPSLPRLHPVKAKVKAYKSQAATESVSCGSITSFVHEESIDIQDCKEARPVAGPADTLLAEIGPGCKEKVSGSADAYGSTGSHGFLSENIQVGAATSPQRSPCFKNDCLCSSPMHAGKEMVPGLVLPLNGVGCGKDAALATKDSTCGDNEESTVSDATKALQGRKLSMERMRQRYLDCLKEQEAETVRLRKQEMMARKQAGEWMLDSAIGEILQKLAPDGEAGVKVIVEAFETIMQQSDSDSHQDDDATITLDC